MTLDPWMGFGVEECLGREHSAGYEAFGCAFLFPKYTHPPSTHSNRGR